MREKKVDARFRKEYIRWRRGGNGGFDKIVTRWPGDGNINVAVDGSQQRLTYLRTQASSGQN